MSFHFRVVNRSFRLLAVLSILLASLPVPTSAARTAAFPAPEMPKGAVAEPGAHLPTFDSPLPTPGGGKSEKPLPLGNAITATLSAEGGALTAPGGIVTLHFPPGAVRAETTLRLTTAEPRSNEPDRLDKSDQPHGLLAFDLECVGDAAGLARAEEAHIRFHAPITVTVDLTARVLWRMELSSSPVTAFSNVKWT